MLAAASVKRSAPRSAGTAGKRASVVLGNLAAYGCDHLVQVRPLQVAAFQLLNDNQPFAFVGIDRERCASTGAQGYVALFRGLLYVLRE